MGTVSWQREAWEAQVAAAGLRPGQVVTALALAGVADEQGVAVPGLSWLAETSRCSASTAYSRVIALLIAGLLERDGKALRATGGDHRRARQTCRYRLVIPGAPD